jgi:AAHS family 4-hydroxybenzoate transporter-like MFS transporter
MESRKVYIHDVIDHSRIGRAQYVALALCALLMLSDGFTTQAFSYIVPVLANDWHLPKSILGSIFSSVLIGLMIGNFGISPFAKRFGTKKMTVWSTAAFGLFTLLTVFVTNVPQLIALRLLTGIGLGSAVPCAVGLTSEFSPKRTRATFVLLIYVGYSLGFTVAGFCCGAMIPRFGWTAPLWVCGLGPIVLTLLLLTANAHKNSDGAVSGLFSARLRVGTFLLWVVYNINLAEFYFLQSWLPTFLHSLSYSPRMVVWVTAISTVGGMAAGLILGPLMDRFGPYIILSALFLFGGISMLAISMALGATHFLLVLAAFCCGACTSGGQKGIVALAALFYPADLRAPGVAWASGIGRLGGAGGTYLAGVLYASNWRPEDIFRVAAAPAVVAAIFVGFMGWLYSGDGSLPSSALTQDS